MGSVPRNGRYTAKWAELHASPANVAGYGCGHDHGRKVGGVPGSRLSHGKRVLPKVHQTRREAWMRCTMHHTKSDSGPQCVNRSAGEIFSVRRRISIPAPAVTPWVERFHCGSRNDGPASTNGPIFPHRKRYFARTGNCHVVAAVPIEDCGRRPLSKVVSTRVRSGLCRASTSTDKRGRKWISTDGPAIKLVSPVPRWVTVAPGYSK